ncbi:hypothetical protein, partial [Zavarzinella formosa]|uniref:hypothetical protein n=1 Tax=Zavarzinella formosa TaxID=360055 RepID=UPI00138AEC45
LAELVVRPAEALQPLTPAVPVERLTGNLLAAATACPGVSVVTVLTDADESPLNLEAVLATESRGPAEGEDLPED